MSAPPSRSAAQRVQAATVADIASWLDLVREVEPAFGPMPDFEETLRRKIDQGGALCVRRDDAGAPFVDGGVLLGGAGPDRWIRWLAVRSSARRRGIGRALMCAAFERGGTGATFSLDTFGADNPYGVPARSLYARLGFDARQMVEPGPEGGTRQRFVRPPGSSPR
jgi:ribosomal protein S18 acetylase RimI-like enzyme